MEKTTLHIFTEELSFKKLADQILPILLPKDTGFKVYTHRGKQDLEQALTKTLPVISKKPGAKVLITRDQDSGNCINVKRDLEKIITGKCFCQYKIRIVCHELECWMLGDMEAIAKAYPRFKAELYQYKADYRTVDRIADAPERLIRIIPELKQNKSLPKLEFANRVASHMNIEANSSTSFKHFIIAIRQLTIFQSSKP